MLVSCLLLLVTSSSAGGPALAERLDRAKRLLEAADRTEARRELSEALRLFPASPAVRNFLGVLEAEEQNYRAAEQHFREAIAKGPRYIDAYLNLGRLYQQNAAQDREAAPKALAVYAEVLAFEPAHAESHYQSAVLRQAAGDFSRSLEHLEKLRPNDQERPHALAVRCGNHAGRGEREEADQAADRLIARRDLTEADVRRILPILTSHRREDLAVRLLEALRSERLASHEALRQLGRLYEGQKQFGPARRVLEEATTAQPRSVELLLDLARVAHEERDHRGALGYLAHARDLDPENAGVHFFFGMVCVDLDLGVEAFNSLKEAVRLEPDNPSFNYALGAVALHRRDPAEALPYFRKYAERKPEDPRGTLAIGVAAFKAHDFVTARAELTKVAEHRETKAGACYFLARIAREENDEGEALRLAQRAVEAQPGFADAYAELGILHLRRGEPDQAEQVLRKCLELDPDNYLGNFHLLMLYQRTKDPRSTAQAQRFEEIKEGQEKKADEFRRLIDVRPR
jgi:tetratricopeptide (TPR) repeat protein